MIIGLLALASAGHAAFEGNVLRVFDEFIVSIAPSDKNYRTDIQLGADPDHVPPGRMLGKSAIAGYYTYRPRAYADLKPDEKGALRKDPRFRVFLAATRATTDGEVAGDPLRPEPITDQVPTVTVNDMKTPFFVSSRPRRKLETFTVPAEEMLRDRPIFIALP